VAAQPVSVAECISLCAALQGLGPKPPRAQLCPHPTCSILAACRTVYQCAPPATAAVLCRGGTSPPVQGGDEGDVVPRLHLVSPLTLQLPIGIVHQNKHAWSPAKVLLCARGLR